MQIAVRVSGRDVIGIRQAGRFGVHGGGLVVDGAAVMDRVNTTWEVWQGTTMRCVQCHAHPYDPYPHEDYYRVMAFFDSTEDADLDDWIARFAGFPIVQLIVWDSATYWAAYNDVQGTPLAATQHGQKMRSLLKQRGRAGTKDRAQNRNQYAKRSQEE